MTVVDKEHECLSSTVWDCECRKNALDEAMKVANGYNDHAPCAFSASCLRCASARTACLIAERIGGLK